MPRDRDEATAEDRKRYRIVADERLPARVRVWDRIAATVGGYRAGSLAAGRPAGPGMTRSDLQADLTCEEAAVHRRAGIVAPPEGRKGVAASVTVPLFIVPRPQGPPTTAMGRWPLGCFPD